DLVLDIVTAVADETPASAFDLAGRAVELGYDLRLVCRELSRVVRDLLVLSVDPSRLADPEIAGEGERDRLKELAARFSREDLMRSFDVLSKAEADIRAAAQPRYHLEMALLRWMHLRKLVPLTELLTGASSIGHRPTSIVDRPSVVDRTTADRQSNVDDRRSTMADRRSTTPAAAGGRDAFLD